MCSNAIAAAAAAAPAQSQRAGQRTSREQLEDRYALVPIDAHPQQFYNAGVMQP